MCLFLLRCPSNTPTLRDTFPVEYTHMCTGFESNSSRLNTDSHHALYMIDNREDTAWYSRNVAEAEVTLTLNSATQVKTTIGHISVIQNKT